MLPLPKNDAQDKLRNRRMLAFLSFYFLMVWPFCVMAIDVMCGVEAGKIMAYLGYAGTFGSSPVIGYFLSCRKVSDP